MCNVSGPASLQPASIGPGVEGMFPKLQMKEAVMYSRKNEGTLPPLPPHPWWGPEPRSWRL